MKNHKPLRVTAANVLLIKDFADGFFKRETSIVREEYRRMISFLNSTGMTLWAGESLKDYLLLFFSFQIPWIFPTEQYC